MRPRNFFEINESGVGISGNPPGIHNDFGFFTGKGIPIVTGAAFPSMSSLKAAGSAHISGLNPFAPKASVLSSLLELARGDIPGLLSSLRRHLTTIQGLKASGIKNVSQTLGDEYLNGVFGWAPIIRDVDRAVKVLLELDSLLFKSDSTRRSVRRVVQQVGAQKSENLTLWVGHPWSDTPPIGNSLYYNSAELSGIGLGGVANGALVDWSTLLTYSVNTSARFSTGFYPTTTNNGHLDRAIDLLGLKLTPAVIWELTPWSWLIDWFLHIGTVIQNLSTLGLSNTILQYAYSTARVERVTSGVGTPQFQRDRVNSITSFSGNMYWVWRCDTKVRIAASPFGFDVSLNSLNAGQWGILSALGLARSR